MSAPRNALIFKDNEHGVRLAIGDVKKEDLGKIGKNLEAENRLLRQALDRLIRENQILIRQYQELANFLEAKD